ncbi:hypothetical protein KBC79_03380 [Candidatus Woesebacteria bacterium]|nr:hypothetical protein [Candidatus Woesebacteria bacterium]
MSEPHIEIEDFNFFAAPTVDAGVPPEQPAPTAETAKKKDPPKDPQECARLLGFESLEQLVKTYIQQDLEASFNNIYATRSVRKDLVEVLERTVGDMRSNVPDELKGLFVDPTRGEGTIESEYREFTSAQEKYVRDGTDDSRVDMCLEAADFLFQIVSLTLRTDDDPRLNRIVAQNFDVVFDHLVMPRLKQAKTELLLVQLMGRIKYAIRGNLEARGYKGKQHDFENAACLVFLKEWKQRLHENDPKKLAEYLGFGQIVDAYNSLLEKPDYALSELVRRKYGNPLEEDMLLSTDYRQIRRLTGRSSVLQRVFGDIKRGRATESYTNEDGELKQTDIKQYTDAVEAFRSTPSEENKVNLVKKAASFVWQGQIVDQLHTASAEKDAVQMLMVVQQETVRRELQHPDIGIEWEVIERVARLVFGVRALAETQPKLEDELVKLELNRELLRRAL